MKDKIIAILGENHTDTIRFTEVRGDGKKDNRKVYGLYTYEGDVFVLKESMDIEFDSLSKEEKKEIIKYMENKKYILDPTLQ